MSPPLQKRGGKKSIPVVTGIRNFEGKHKEAVEITTTTLSAAGELVCLFIKVFRPSPPSPATNGKHMNELISS